MTEKWRQQGGRSRKARTLRRARVSKWFATTLGVLALVPWVALGVAASQAERSSGADAVVLLHGLGRSYRSMRPLVSPLSDAGYSVHNISYPSTDLAPEALDAYLHEKITQCCSGAPHLHFVTHSLGGILVRAYLAKRDVPNLGRVVMLAPPNRGSELVDVLGGWSAFSWALGPTATQLGTEPGSLPNRLPASNFDVGVIAGTDSINPLGSWILPGESDGTVSVRSTQLDGMSDFITVESSHTFIMRSGVVASQVVEFLTQGRFKHSGM